MTFTEYFAKLDVKNAEMSNLEKAWKDAVQAHKADNSLKAEIAVTKAKLNYLVALEDYTEYANAMEKLTA